MNKTATILIFIGSALVTACGHSDHLTRDAAQTILEKDLTPYGHRNVKLTVTGSLETAHTPELKLDVTAQRTTHGAVMLDKFDDGWREVKAEFAESH